MRQIEGYWKEDDHISRLESKVRPGVFLERVLPARTNYPMPIPNILTKKEAEEVYTYIVAKELLSNRVAYKGCSFSRITREGLGNIEFENEEWAWPGDFSKHYVLEHRVRPTDSFLKYIGFIK